MPEGWTFYSDQSLLGASVNGDSTVLTDHFLEMWDVQIVRRIVGDILKKISIIRHIMNLPKFRSNQLRQINKYSL